MGRVIETVFGTITMKITKTILASLLLGTTSLVLADDAKPAQKPKPYTLKTCIVSGEDIGKDADMKPHVFTYQGQEVKLCCKGCLKDFNKEPAKYLKKIEEAQKQ